MKDVKAAVEAGDFATALAAAVAVWRTCRRAELAELVDSLAARCVLPAIGGRDKASYHRAWLALAGARADDALVTAALVAGLARSLPVRDIDYLNPKRDVKRHRAFLERIAALATRAADPQIARALAELLEDPPFSVDDCTGVVGPVIALIVELGDARSVARLGALVARPVAKTATMRDYLARALPIATRAIAAEARPRLPRGVTELVAALAPVTVTATARVEAIDLLAECLANPDDDAPRLVYADALLEADDPRGEFIQLQLRDARGELSELEARRMASLQRKHEKTWLGDLARVTKLRRWERGFLVEAELLQGASADPATWKRVARDPRMATIRTLHKGTASEELYRTFVFSSALVGLREIAVQTSDFLRALASLAHPLDRITLTAGLTRDALALLESVAARTGVHRLSFEVKQPPAAVIEQLLAWPTRTRFDELCAMPSYRVGEAWDTGLRLWLGAFDRLAPVRRLGVGDHAGCVVVERGPRGYTIDAVLAQEAAIVQLARVLAPPVERITIRGTPVSWAAPTAAFGRALAKLAPKTLELRDGWRTAPH